MTLTKGSLPGVFHVGEDDTIFYYKIYFIYILRKIKINIYFNLKIHFMNFF